MDEFEKLVRELTEQIRSATNELKKDAEEMRKKREQRIAAVARGENPYSIYAGSIDGEKTDAPHLIAATSEEADMLIEMWEQGRA